MIQGMTKILSRMNPSNATRSAAKFPSLNIYEKASVILSDVTDSVKRFNSSVGQAIEFMDAIPLHDGTFDQLVADADLPALEDGLFYVENNTLNNFTTALMANVTDTLSLTVSVTDQLADVIECTVVNGVLNLNGIAIKTGEYVKDGVTYAIMKGDIIVNNTKMYIDDMFHRVMQSDEINRVNQAFLTAIAKGDSSLDVILNRIKVEFENAMDETKQYIQFVSSAISNGVTGYMSLLKTMYKVVTTGVFASGSKTISFTNNSQYVMRNFTSGIIETVTGAFTTAWNATKSVISTLTDVLSTLVSKAYNIAKAGFEAILSNYTTSKINFEANNTNFVIGIIQSTITASEWESFPSNDAVSFSDFWKVISELGPQKMKVLWGTMYVWVDQDYTDRIYIEHKLRTDITNFNCPFGCNVPVNSSSGTNLTLVYNTNNNLGSVYLRQQATQDTPADGPQMINLTTYSSFYNKNLYELYSQLSFAITSRDIIEYNYVEADELSKSKRIMRAYAVFVTWALMCELYKTAPNISLTVNSDTNFFTQISSTSGYAYRACALGYTLCWLTGVMNSGNVFYNYWNITSSNCWDNLTTIAGLAQSATVKHIWAYTPITLVQMAAFAVETHYNLSTTLLDVRKQAHCVQGISSPLSNLTEYSVSATINTVLTAAPVVLYSLILGMAFSNEYSNINLTGSLYIMSYYGSSLVGDEMVFWAPPNFSRTDLVTGILLIAGIVIGVMLITVVPTMIIKHKASIAATTRAAKIEGLWGAATKDPSPENIKAYRKAVKTNNLQSKLFGGSVFSKASYWGDSGSNTTDNLLSLSSMLSGTDKSTNTTIQDIKRLITGPSI